MGSRRLADAVGIAVLAGGLVAIIMLTGLERWLVTVVESQILRVLLYIGLLIGLALWGLAVWPKVSGAIAWVIWSIGFGGLGGLCLYLSIARHYGRTFSFVYGLVFTASGLIGIAGVARTMSIDHINRKKR